MKSWRFHGTGRPLTLDEVEVPHAGPGEVVVDVMAAGLCHSDVGALNDPRWMTSFPRIPMTLGHENAGIISEVGPGMEDWKVGDRVGPAPVMPDGDAIGYEPKVRATGANLVRLPPELSEMGAIATDTCAMRTSSARTCVARTWSTRTCAARACGLLLARLSRRYARQPWWIRTR